ncbi:uncharacterized protein LODBEIA_P02730 [Lodderomyces beijingensis]|uniref:Uncharacterized protein n=1 Tax=Lodderomyces beijingensis TaxID=1775926 RepID=A0ABP0ZDT9_9ASCO
MLSSESDDAACASTEGSGAAAALEKRIEQMPLEQLNNYQDEIAAEFKKLSRQYVESRLSRITSMIDKLGESIELAQGNNKSWLKIYNFEVEIINNMITNTEDLIMVSNGTMPSKPDLVKNLDEYEEELKEIFRSMRSPFDFDATFKYETKELQDDDNQQKADCGAASATSATSATSANKLSNLPFPYLFNDIFQPHRTNLKCITKSKDYQTELIKRTCCSNATITWKQYHSKVAAKKQKLILKTNHQLNELYKEYNQLNQSHLQETMDRYYYNSLLTPERIASLANDGVKGNNGDVAAMLRRNHDSTYVTKGSRLLPKNEHELSSIRQELHANGKRAEQVRAGIKRSYNEAFIPPDLVNYANDGDGDELDGDLNAIKRAVLEKTGVMGVASESNTNKLSEAPLPVKKEKKNDHELTKDNVVVVDGEEEGEVDDDVDDKEEEEEEEEEYDDDDDDDDEDDSDDEDRYESYEEVYDVEEDMTPAEKESRQMYKNVLFQEQLVSIMPFPSVPPLNVFPKIDR